MAHLYTRFKKSAFVKGIVYFIVGIFTYPGLAMVNRLKVEGMDILQKLPRKNVLFVSNHQTYFAEVISLIHIFCAASWGRKKGLGWPLYLCWPFTRIYYVAAKETMQSSWLTKLFTLAGAVTVKRTWVPSGKEVQKGLETRDTRNITTVLKNNWVITFPQGTTTPFAPGRRGTAFIIKHFKPIVVPVVVSGFSTAFDKKGLKFRKKGTRLSIRFKEPLQIDYEDSAEEILTQIMDSIEQSKSYMPQ